MNASRVESREDDAPEPAEAAAAQSRETGEAHVDANEVAGPRTGRTVIGTVLFTKRSAEVRISDRKIHPDSFGLIR